MYRCCNVLGVLIIGMSGAFGAYAFAQNCPKGCRNFSVKFENVTYHCYRLDPGSASSCFSADKEWCDVVKANVVYAEKLTGGTCTDQETTFQVNKCTCGLTCLQPANAYPQESRLANMCSVYAEGYPFALCKTSSQ